MPLDCYQAILAYSDILIVALALTYHRIMAQRPSPGMNIKSEVILHELVDLVVTGLISDTFSALTRRKLEIPYFKQEAWSPS